MKIGVPVEYMKQASGETDADAVTEASEPVSEGAPEPAAPKNDDPHPVSTVGEGEFDTIKDSENAG